MARILKGFFAGPSSFTVAGLVDGGGVTVDAVVCAGESSRMDVGVVGGVGEVVEAIVGYRNLHLLLSGFCIVTIRIS